MARTTNRLTDRTVKAILKSGRQGKFADGAGLLLNTKGGARWVLLIRVGGKTREFGLGSAREGYTTLARAREKARAARERIEDGQDPREKSAAPVTIPTFGECADDYIASKKSGWTNAKHLDQWRSTLGKGSYCAKLRLLPVNEVGTDQVLQVLRPIWVSKSQTASRLRGRIESVLDAAKTKGFRDGLENPARWKGHLSNLLTAPQKLTKGHHRALEYSEVPAFIRSLKSVDTIAARALHFLVLTAGRTNEILGARWPEVDFEKKVWTVPATRMKGKLGKRRPHAVPLVDDTLAILREMHTVREDDGGFIFPGRSPSRSLSTIALSAVLKKMGMPVTTHGMRATFRTWGAEETNFEREVLERALAHVVGSEVERAYDRGQMLERRRALMSAWADHSAGKSNVLPFVREA